LKVLQRAPLNTVSWEHVGENTWSSVCATGCPFASAALPCLSGVAVSGVAAALGSSQTRRLSPTSSSMHAAASASAAAPQHYDMSMMRCSRMHWRK